MLLRRLSPVKRFEQLSIHFEAEEAIVKKIYISNKVNFNIKLNSRHFSWGEYYIFYILRWLNLWSIKILWIMVSYSMSSAQCPVSSVQCPVCVQCPVSPESCVRCPLTSVQCPVSGVQWPVASGQCPVPISWVLCSVQLMSNVLWPVSSAFLRRPVSSVQCPVPSVQCPVPVSWVTSVQCAVSSVLCSEACVQCPVSSVQCPVSSVQCPVSSVQCPVSSVQCPVYSVLCLCPESCEQWPVSSVQCPVFWVLCPVYRHYLSNFLGVARSRCSKTSSSVVLETVRGKLEPRATKNNEN